MLATAATQAALRVREITTDAEFELLRNAWNDLARSVCASVFLRHEWFSAAWAWRRADASLWILCVYSDDVLVGVLPLVRPSRSTHGIRVLEFLAVPDTQCCDLLVETEASDRVCGALIDHLIMTSSEWDALHLDRLPLHSSLEGSLLPGVTARGIHCRLHAAERNLFIDLRSAWKDYYATRHRSLKKAFNLAANRLGRAGVVQVERIGAQEIDSTRLRHFLDEAVAISSRSWKRGTGNSLDNAGPLSFIQRLTDHAYTHDWICLWLLRLNDRPIAMEYQLVYGKKVHALRADFDDEYQNVSPGSYLNHRLIEEMFDAGLERYYMGPGKNAYKTRWSESGDTLYTFVAYSPTLRGRAGALGADLKPMLKSLRDRLVM